MESPLKDSERRVLAVLQRGLPLTLSPYADMAREAGMDTLELLDVLKRWRSEGKLRRMGAVVSHTGVGLEAGAMVVWQVDAARIEEVGAIFAVFGQVSHAYERAASELWPYNVYTMVHGATEGEVAETVGAMSRASGVDKYSQLRTVRELKKVPPTYIKDR